MSFSTERARRATAGKRMTSLVGSALEEDNAFWGHDTWESDQESFHASDEGSVKDEFDSDFDESESDHEEEEVAASEALDKDMLTADRTKKHVDISKAGRDLWRKSKPKALAQKRALGQGLNAGLVLNLPSTAPPSSVTSTSPLPSLSLVVTGPHPAVRHNKHNHHDSVAPLAATRPRRAGGLSIYSSRYRAARSDATTPSAATTTTSNRKSAASSASPQKKKKRQRYTQEELLLEAVHETEPENERWRLARKRMQEESEARREHANASSQVSGTLVERFSSRRGYLTTINFPEMDHVPAILQPTPLPVPPDPVLCVITGQTARYKDPLTGYGYFDSNAFRVLREKHAAGLLNTTKSKKVPPTELSEMMDDRAALPIETPSTDTVMETPRNTVVKSAKARKSTPSTGDTTKKARVSKVGTKKPKRAPPTPKNTVDGIKTPKVAKKRQSKAKEKFENTSLPLNTSSAIVEVERPQHSVIPDVSQSTTDNTTNDTNGLLASTANASSQVKLPSVNASFQEDNVQTPQIPDGASPSTGAEETAIPIDVDLVPTATNILEPPKLLNGSGYSSSAAANTSEPPKTHIDSKDDSVLQPIEPQNSFGTSSAGSGTRHSPRRHKPTTKLLEGMALPMPIVSLPSLIAVTPSIKENTATEENTKSSSKRS
jgi:vacuolar protein sorting-associated protein 72